MPCVLSRCATEGSLCTDVTPMKPESPDSSRLTQDPATPQQHLSSSPAHFTITSSSNPTHCELISVSSSSPIMAKRSCSSALISSHGQDAPAVVTVTPRSREESGDAHHELLSFSETAERDQVRSSELLTLT